MSKAEIKIKLKAHIARRAGKAYGLLTTEEVEKYTDQVIKELKLIQALRKA